MKKWIKWYAILLLVIGLLWPKVAEADVDCGNLSGEPLYTCLGRQIDDLAKSLEMSKQATAPLEAELNKLDAQIKKIQTQITAAVAKQKQLEVGIKEREEKLSVQYILLSKKMREYYKQLRAQSLLTRLLSTVGSGQLQRELAYQGGASDFDRQMIVKFAGEIGGLEEDKKDLETQKKQLASLQTNIDKQAEFYRTEVKKAKSFQADLSGKIAALSAQQQSILNEKQGTFQTTVGDVPLADDANSRPDYNPGFSPAFAVFSFGAPHFKGMSQYGALGRAKSGQSVETILKAYYSGVEIKKDYDAGKQISVSGYGRMDIETYVKRIYEVPNSWGDNGGFEALKAQAVAARSYALAWTDEGKGGAICTTESCQVYKNSNKGGKWEEAVNATKGWVLWANGKPVKAWYASTAGGYLMGYTDSYSGFSTSGFWDADGGRSGWTSQAYEKKADSPWFYKGWYKTRTGDSCGRSHPWLNGEEMADIINAWMVLKSSSDSRVSPLGGCWGGNPYSMDELRSKGGYSKVTGVSVTYSDGGYTSNVRFETDKGVVEISGADFKKVFNLRAPGRISVKSALFNIEKK